MQDSTDLYQSGGDLVLSENSIQPEHKELLEIVNEETDRLTSAVTDAIQMARIEAGRIELRKGPRSVADMIRQSVAKLAGSLDARPVEVRARRISSRRRRPRVGPHRHSAAIRQCHQVLTADSPISIEAAMSEDAWW